MSTVSAVNTAALDLTKKQTNSEATGPSLDKDSFLKLLTAQMKYQDPQSPTDSSALISQSATYSQVEALQTISEQNTAMLAMQRASSAGALVGKTVSYTATDGSTVTGQISSVTIPTASTEAVATIGGTTVPVGRLTAISA